MAEDLKIRVKVEPNPTGLQGKLDAISKKYKLNVELFDDKELSKQITTVQSKLDGLIKSTAKRLSTMTDATKATQDGIAAGVQALVKGYGDVAKKQEEIKNSANGLSPVDSDAIAKSETKIASLRKELEAAKNEENEFKKKLSDVYFKDSGSIADSVKSSLQKDLKEMEELANSSSKNIQEKLKDVFSFDSIEPISFLNDLFQALDDEGAVLDDIKEDYEHAYDEILDIVQGADEDIKNTAFSKDLIKSGSETANQITQIYQQIAIAIDNIKGGKEVKANLDLLIKSIKEFYNVTGLLTNGKGNKDKVADISARIKAEEDSITAIKEKAAKKNNESNTDKSGENAGASAGKKAGEKFVQAFGEVVRSKTTKELSLDELISKTFNMNDVLNNVMGKDSRSDVVKGYSKDVISGLNDIANQTERIFDIDLTDLDDGMQKTVGTIKNQAIAIKGVMGEISTLFGKVKGGNFNDGDFEMLTGYLQQLQGMLNTLKETYSSATTGSLGKVADNAGTDDALTARISKMEESMRRLIQLQVSLTLEKKNTMQAEDNIGKSIEENKNKIAELLKQQQQLLNAEPKPGADVSGKASDAAKNAGKAKEDLKDAAATVKEINTKGLSTVLKTVQKFVNDICSDSSKVDAVQQKLAEFNIKMGGFKTAVTDYTTAIADLNTYFAQSATILEALNGSKTADTGKDAGKETTGKKAKAATETEQQTAAKLTALLNKAESSSGKVVEAVHSASEVLQGIAKELGDAAESAESVNKNGQIVLNAVTKLHELFEQYGTALAEADKVEADENCNKETVKTEAKAKTKKKAKAANNADVDVTPLNDAAAAISKVITKYKRAAKSTDDFAEQATKLITAGTKINAIIKKFNDISELNPDGLKLKIDTGKQESTDATKAVAVENTAAEGIKDASQSIKDGADKINDAADKIESAADKNSTATDESIKKAGVLQADTVNRNYNKAKAKSDVDMQYYRDNILGSKDNFDVNAKKAYAALEQTIKKAADAKAAFDKTGSVEDYNKFTIAVRDLSDCYDALDSTLQATRDKFKEMQSEMNALGKTMNAQYNRQMEDYALIESKLTMSHTKGYNNLVAQGTISAARDAAKELNEAKKAFFNDKSSENADRYRQALTNMSVAAKELKDNLRSVATYVDNAFKTIPDKIRQAENTIATLKETKTKTKDEGKIAEIQALIDKYTILAQALKEVDTNGSYTQLEDIFAKFAQDGQETGVTIKSLKSLFDALEVQVRKTTSGVRLLNAEMRNSRNVDSWQKSMQNTMYTAERYFNNNSKISDDLEAYSKFVDFFNTYKDKISNREFTQENSVQMSKDWSELKRYIQDAGLETDKLSVKLQKLFQVNIKSQLANQVINAFQQGLRQVYQNVVDIDTAMTELKKVTDETSGTYEKFLSEAGERAKELGVGISDIVNATADFARLGYNLQEATDISNSAILFKQVGDGVESMDDATSDIISAMKDFNIEAEDSTQITDKFNEVGM